MLRGLEAFNQGLVEHGLLKRSEKNGETVEQAIKREISDMTRLLIEIQQIKDAPKRLLTEGLVKYVMGFYLVMRTGNIKKYKEIIQRIDEYFRFMDEKYYSDLEGKSSDMKELAVLLDEKKIVDDVVISMIKGVK